MNTINRIGSINGRAINPNITSSIEKTAPTMIKGSKTSGRKISETITLSIQKVILRSTAANKSAIKIIMQKIAPITFILQISYYI
jgi:hypothetical protein